MKEHTDAEGNRVVLHEPDDPWSGGKLHLSVYGKPSLTSEDQVAVGVDVPAEWFAVVHGGAALIAEERERQMKEEGWTAEHDDTHERGELLDAGLSYIRAAINVGHPATQQPPQEWPWDVSWWKPTNRIRMLVKAGALIAAEIDRLIRKEM